MPASESLPIAGYDELSQAELTTRIRSLGPDDLDLLIEHERDHAGRPAVLQVLQHRRDALDRGASPTSGDPGAAATQSPTGAGSAPEAASPQTEGPPQNPPSQGDPTNPAQPRR